MHSDWKDVEAGRGMGGNEGVTSAALSQTPSAGGVGGVEGWRALVSLCAGLIHRRGGMLGEDCFARSACVSVRRPGYTAGRAASINGYPQLLLRLGPFPLDAANLCIVPLTLSPRRTDDDEIGEWEMACAKAAVSNVTDSTSSLNTSCRRSEGFMQ